MIPAAFLRRARTRTPRATRALSIVLLVLLLAPYAPAMAAEAQEGGDAGVDQPAWSPAPAAVATPHAKASLPAADPAGVGPDGAAPARAPLGGEPTPADPGAAAQGERSSDAGAAAAKGVILNQVVAKTYSHGCTTPAARTAYDIRDLYVTHWIYYRVDTSPMDIRRLIVNDDTGVTWIEDIRTHSAGTGFWCAEMNQPIDGSFFQANPGNYHFELYFKDTSNLWVKQGSNLPFKVWPTVTEAGTYRNTIGDGVSTFSTSDAFARVYTKWDTTNARNAGHTIKYHWYRPGLVEHAVGGSIGVGSGFGSPVIRFDDGGRESFLDVDLSDDTAIKLLPVSSSERSGITSARLWILAEGENCGATGGTHSLYANSNLVTTYDPCTRWSQGAYTWSSFTLTTGQVVAGANSYEVKDNGGSWTDRGAFFGVDTTADQGQSTIKSNGGADTPGELMWFLEIVKGGGTVIVTSSDSLDIQSSGAWQYPGTWTVRAWLDGDTNYMHAASRTFTLSSTPSGPANDPFASAVVVSSVPYSTSQSTTGATVESGEPLPCGSMGATVWYRYTPASSGTVTIDTLQSSNYDTVLAAYTGSSVSGLTQVPGACNDDFSGTLSQISFAATAGTVYRIQLGGFNGATGTASLRVQLVANSPPTACINTPTVSVLTVSVSSCSSDPNGDALTYDWDWADGTAHATTASASHTYACPGGTYLIRLTVNDGRGGTGTTTRSVTTNEPDTDGDGLKNCVESFVYGTSPTVADSDGDGSSDGAEVGYWVGDWNTDYDGDGARGGTSCSFHTGSNLCDNDSDSDGLRDGLEISHPTATFGTNSAYWPNPRGKDIYVEVDYMVRQESTTFCPQFFPNVWCYTPGYSAKPTETQLQMVRDAFSARGIRVVFDNGQMGGGNEVPYRQRLRFDDGGAGNVDFQDYKRGGDGITANFNVANRYGVFHYLIMGHNFNSDPCSSGVAYRTDDDFFVSYGLITDGGCYFGWGYDTFDEAIAGTIIHELGHNLCLGQGSATTRCLFPDIDRDGSSDYRSSMNYEYQMTMVDYSDGSRGANDHDDWSDIKLSEPLLFGVEPAHGAGSGEPDPASLPNGIPLASLSGAVGRGVSSGPLPGGP